LIASSTVDLTVMKCKSLAWELRQVRFDASKIVATATTRSLVGLFCLFNLQIGSAGQLKQLEANHAATAL
jgi:hypothetical protein